MPAAAAAAAAKTKATRTYLDQPNDPQLQLIDDYNVAMQERRDRLGRARHGQVYTPWDIVEFLAKSAIEGVVRHHTPAMLDDARVLDPCCGAGPFLVSAVRRWSAITGRSHAEVIRRNVYGADLDIGAVLTARAVLRSMVPLADSPCYPMVYWADSLADFAWLPRRVRIDALDIVTVDKLNAEFEKATLAYLAGPYRERSGTGPHSRGQDALTPLGVVDVLPDGPSFHWFTGIADGRPQFAPVPIDRPYVYPPPEPAAAPLPQEPAAQ